MDIIYMFVLFPVVSKSLLVLGRQENNELTERSSDQMPYDRNWLVIDKEQDYVHVGDKPEYSCSTKNDVQFLIGNPLRWEKVGRDGSRIKISTLANVEEGQLRKYNVLLYTNNTYMTFKLSFPQGITETDEGFLYCVQYDKNDIVLFERRVEVHVIAKTTTAAPTTTRAQITTSISNNICIDGHVMCTHLFPGECEVALHLMILCPASCDICYRPERYCADRSNDCSKVKDQCNDHTIKQICQSTCNVCDANGCNSTLVSSALSKNLVLSHSAGDYCSDGTRTNADSVILKLCNARTDKMWRQGIQVVSNCKQISLYAPVSSFGSFSHQLGIFLGCTDTGIKIGIQKCNDHFKEQALVSGDTSTAFSNADVYHVLIVK
ncbi:uncharacterized protein LOC127717583 isoform X1 [Mytilus californianus]|uniref:uncharacterized protein LOC127717583 isoform X1 n=1 Tax=Mytilus californianus TaxID=6549 RepID=UPI002246B343|nr:uncharacterized protein LOC127717583 isoform X1 [Mytilus californianus]